MGPRRSHRLILLIPLGLCALLAQVALAAPPANSALTCPPQPELLDRYQHLRALSLDLRGTIPTMAEYAALDDHKEVPTATVEAWLASDAFTEQAVRRHRDMLWSNITNLRLMSVPSNLRRTGQLYWRNGSNVAIYARGQRVACLDEPATWDQDGHLVFKTQPDGTKREGWVHVSPYWAPKSKIKVCAHDAQSGAVSPSGKTCGKLGAHLDPYCGCGPNLRWCRYGDTNRQVLAAMGASIERLVRDVIGKNKPYIDLFKSTTMAVNGPMVFFFKYQAQLSQPLRVNPPVDVAKLPDLPFTAADTWVNVPLASHHAGILTHPAFLLRFQTNRARASRFYNTFLCQPFQAPDDGIDVSAVAAVSEPDLQKRPGCKYCHGLLEPVASYWGRWTESGATYLPKVLYPPFSADCQTCALTGKLCSQMCKKDYKIKAYAVAEKSFLGMLHAYVFRRPEHVKNVENGPRLMALGAIADNRLPRCLSVRTASWLFGRELDKAEKTWTDTVATGWVQGGYSYRKLVGALVADETYRRVR